jgi:hypothetical protein
MSARQGVARLAVGRPRSGIWLSSRLLQIEHLHDVLVQHLLALEAEAADEIKHSVVAQDLADNLAGR